MADIIPANIDFSSYVKFIGEQESQELHWANKWRDSLLDYVQHGEVLQGATLPWVKTHQHVRLRPGELSIWAGINGHRKSMVLGQVMLWLSQELRVCIASLEMKPEVTLYRMLRQASKDFPNKPEAEKFSSWSDGRICIYDQLDTVEAERILGMAHYAAIELKCDHIVIDSLTKCGLPTDDYSLQTKFVDRLAWLAKSTGAHIHLVCHMRKGSSERDTPGKFDIRGASQISDLADNVFVVWKNKKREEAKFIENNDPINASDETKHIIENEFDQKIIVEKQRNGAYEGAFGFLFSDKSFQCHDRNGSLINHNFNSTVPPYQAVA